MSQELHRLVIAPLEAHFKQQHIKTIVVVPDSFMRMLPFSALHDGKQYLIERFAISVAPGLSILNTGGNQGKRKGHLKALLAGMSEPGDVVEKLTPALMNAIFGINSEPDHVDARGLDKALKIRAARLMVASDTQGKSQAQRLASMRAKLALPGVKTEIDQLTAFLGGQPLLDETFTVNRLQQKVLHGNYSHIHLATHGVFGPSAETTFIMLHDDLLTLDRLQDLLRTRTSPVELLGLSACQTAQGDDRAPMGLSGAAVQARVANVLGSLWPISDDAASLLMPNFYHHLLKQDNKAQALQASQIVLLKDPALSHPYYWAPFILVGGGQ